MTPEERATQVCRDSGWTIEPWKYDLIVSALRVAVEAEREACAIAAESEATWVHYNSYETQVDMRARIAAAIRARGVADSTQEISPKEPDDDNSAT